MCNGRGAIGRAVAPAGGLQCSSLQGPGVCSAAPSKARALRRAAVRTSRLGWWVDSKQVRHLGRALDAVDDLPAVRARPFAADAHIGCGKSEAKLGTGRLQS